MALESAFKNEVICRVNYRGEVNDRLILYRLVRFGDTGDTG